eukprot:3669469-Pyramimonas_sp.AAC.1
MSSFGTACGVATASSAIRPGEIGCSKRGEFNTKYTKNAATPCALKLSRTRTHRCHGSQRADVTSVRSQLKDQHIRIGTRQPRAAQAEGFASSLNRGPHGPNRKATALLAWWNKS